MIELDQLKSQLTKVSEVTAFLAEANRAVDETDSAWEFATLEIEQAFDQFMLQLAALDRFAAIKLAAGCARYAFDDVAANHTAQMEEFGFAFHATDPALDGEAIEKQLLNVEQWLAKPDPAALKVVKKGIDPSRQMNLWEEDLFPAADIMFVWILEATQLLSMAVTVKKAGDDDHDSPYEWSYRACVARSADCAFKALARTDRTPVVDLTRMLKWVGQKW